MFHVTILAGGTGTRFWPKSRRAVPKQFLALRGDRSLLAETVARFAGVVPAERVRVLTNAAHVDRARELLPGLPPGNCLGEPVGRDTAAAVGVAAAWVQAEDPAATLLVVPADHWIEPLDAFQADVRRVEAALARHADAVLVLGIPPDRPATGYGYIRCGADLGDGVRAVTRFHEKPDAATAQAYLDQGECLWNAGMFGFRVDALERLLARHVPALDAGLAPLRTAPADRREAVLAAVQPGLPRASFDRAVLEPCAERVVLPAGFRWDDVGSWEALARHLPVDADGNAADGPLVAVDARGNLVEAGDGLVALLGVEDLIVVRTADVTLVAHRDQAERVKELLARLDARPDGDAWR